ncbi:MAG: hypothetical protein HQK76_20820 [Desulfobacterales bacterium]|nr:hypothetical protein [Desulfobacterales bacterium]
MKDLKKIFTVSTFFIITLLFLPIVSESKTKVTFGYEDQQNFPFYIGTGRDIDWNKPGISIELLKLLETKLDIEIDFVRMPWKRCQMDLKSGTLDGIFNASFKKERTEFGVYPMKNDKHDPSLRVINS